jgi:hypothetical protein
MRYAQMTIVLAVAVALSTSACNRARSADDTPRRDTAADDRQRHQDEAARMEERVASLEREWNDMQARLAKDTAAPTAELKAEVKEDLTQVKEAVADLKTTTVENWWERHERVTERNLADVEQDARRFARKWTTPEAKTEVGTTGSATGWEARRNQLVSRMEARLDAMEEALKDVDLKGAKETEVEDTRARIKKLRDDTDRLRNASENDWWEISKARVNEYIDRVDRSIDRLDNDKT